jgi:hypothetical protein
MEIQTGIHVYAILHHLCGLFSQNGMGREIKRQIGFKSELARAF